MKYGANSRKSLVDLLFSWTVTYIHVYTCFVWVINYYTLVIPLLKGQWIPCCTIFTVYNVRTYLVLPVGCTGRWRSLLKQSYWMEQEDVHTTGTNNYNALCIELHPCSVHMYTYIYLSVYLSICMYVSNKHDCIYCVGACFNLRWSLYLCSCM